LTLAVRQAAVIKTAVFRAAWVCAAVAMQSGQLAQASSLSLCDRQASLTPTQQDKLFRFAALVKTELAQSGQRVALIARSGLDLGWFGLRYSHAGLSLQDSDSAPWSVRQLYYACDEGRSRVFDQGMAGFVLGTDDPRRGYVSLVFMPEAESTALARAALNKAQALRVLSSQYSANAYPFSVRYQNCNQWVAELIASAWGNLPMGDDADVQDARVQAQAWLQAQAYEPTVIDVGWRVLMWGSALVPFVHRDDHPEPDLAAKRFRVSMPAAIEAFVHQRLPAATRVELCHTDQHMVIHRGWDAVAEGCVPGPGDTVVSLQTDAPQDAVAGPGR